MTKAYEQAADAPPPLLIAIADGIAEVTLNRPDRGNSISPAMMKALEETWDALQRDREVRVVLLTAAGERHFWYGGRLPRGTTPERLVELIEELDSDGEGTIDFQNNGGRNWKIHVNGSFDDSLAQRLRNVLVNT